MRRAFVICYLASTGQYLGNAEMIDGEFPKELGRGVFPLHKISRAAKVSSQGKVEMGGKAGDQH